ncbi:MAG: HAMP domain-containing histidine kinase [Deltaproteobacteria bacterium]|nr:HAMP domain-containing histidine kinase [Deltaproteobacteria bacterium]
MSNELEKWIHAQTAISKLYVHDFKNPVSAISANLSYLEAVLDNVDEDVVCAVQDSSVALKMLLHMLDNFLNISRLESNEQIEAVPAPLERFVEDSLSRIRKMFTSPEPMLVLSGKIPSQMCNWPIVYARLAVENLILQALHNTPASGKVVLSIRLADEMVIFDVADNGVQIAPEFYDISFQREFQTVAKSKEHARYGRALAMYAVGLSAKALGGDVRVEKAAEQQRIVLRIPTDSKS